jgi:serine/threonine-protein kinase
MGQVHAARHASGRRVVVKRLRDTLVLDGRLAAQLGNEGRVSRRVSHPNVVRVFDHGVSADGTPFIVMEHARGTTLRRLVLEQGPLSLARIHGLISQLLAGLTAIHEAGVVHADIKSSNVIIDTVGGADHLTIIDFGLARTRTSGALIDDGVVAGTPGYMAPEVCRGEAPTTRADVYSAAIVAYELIVGLTPFGGAAPLEVLHRQISEPIVFPDDVHAMIAPELERVLRRALDKDPLQRFPDARDFAIALEEAFDALAAPGAARPRIAPAPAGERERDAVRLRRRELHDALGGGLPDRVIAAYLALADALIAEHRLDAAVRELEGALVRLLPRGSEPPAAVWRIWRIETLLAAMYERLGNPIRARRASMDAYEHAVRTGDRLAEQRAGALMRRLMSSR